MPTPVPRNCCSSGSGRSRSEKTSAAGPSARKKRAVPSRRSPRSVLAVWTASVLCLYGIFAAAGTWWWWWRRWSSSLHRRQLATPPRYLLLEEPAEARKQTSGHDADDSLQAGLDDSDPRKAKEGRPRISVAAPGGGGLRSDRFARRDGGTVAAQDNDVDFDFEAELVESLSRPFGHLPHPLPCLESEARWFGAKVQQRTPATRGLLFVKPYKTASSTAAGVHLRIAWHLRRRRRAREAAASAGAAEAVAVNPRSEKGDGPKFDICRSRFDHSIASHMRYGSRDRGNQGRRNATASASSESSSFLWSIVRDPTDRAVSQFYHFVVGRRGVEATDGALRQALSRPSLSNYYLRILTLDEGDYRWLSSLPLSSSSLAGSHGSAAVVAPRHLSSRHGGDPAEAEAFRRILAGIVSGYDFLAVTERMDESLVAMQMLSRNQFGLASVLYLDAKRGGGYDDGGGKKSCVRIPPSRPSNGELTPGIQEYLHSPEWRSRTYWDRILHRVANRSLDRTIDETIGRDAFERQLGRFRVARRVAVEKCTSRAVFPCDEYGRYHNATDCIWNDSGCGSNCLDEVATELGLW